MIPETHRLVTACWAEGVLSKAVVLPKETTIGEAVLQTASMLRDQVYDSFKYEGDHIPVNDLVISIVPKVPWDNCLTSLTSSGEEVLSVIIRPPDGHTPVMTHVLQCRSLNSDLVRRGAGKTGVHELDDISSQISDVLKRMATLEKEKKESDARVARLEKGKSESDARVKESNERVAKLEKGKMESEARMSNIEKNCDARMARLEKERNEIESQLAKLEKERQEGNEQMAKKQRETKEMLDELTRLTLMIAPLHLRVLLDQARVVILNRCACDSWEDLRGTRSITQLTAYIAERLRLQHDLSSFVCHFNNVRRAGNKAAHTATADDVRKAILQKNLESTERRLLCDLFQFVYDEHV